MLASGFLLCQDSGLCFSVWLSAAVLQLAYFFIQRLFGLNVVVSEKYDFLPDLMSRLCGVRTSLTLTPAFRSCPNISVVSLRLLFRVFRLFLGGTHAASRGFEPRTRVLDSTLLLATLCLFFDLPILVCCWQLSLR